MSDKDTKLRVIIEATNKADAALNDLVSGLRRAEKGSDKLRGSMSLLTVAARGGVAALAATVTVDAAGRVIGLADAYTLAEGRLRLVTSSSAELAGVQDQLYASAQRTRTEYLSNVEGYARLAQNTKDLHLSQSDLLAINETLNKAFIISGATEAERSSTMIQLSQAFSAGVLRGEEFNSVAEQGSRVLQLLADYTGKSRGELKGMAEAGKLTADVLVGSILSGASNINDEFGKLPTTVGQAGTVLKNTLGSLVGDANRSSGATDGLASAIINLANTIDTNRETILSLFTGIVENATNAFDAVMQKVNRVRGVIAALNGEITFSQQAGMGQAELRAYFEAVDSGVGKVQARLSAARQELAALREGGDVAQRQALQQEISSLEFAMQQAKEVQKGLSDAKKEPKKVEGSTTPPKKYEQTNLDKNGLEELTKTYLPLVYAQNQYKEAVEKINLAVKAGQITKEQEAAALTEAKKKLDDATGATKAHNKAVSEQEAATKQAAKEYQSILDRLLPLEVAQRKYNEGLAALDQMDQTRSTESYQVALANLKREYDEAAESAQRYAREAAAAQRAALESELTRKGTAIEISIAQGSMTETEALPFQVDLLKQRLQLQQSLLADMQKSTPQEIAAWNSQAEAIDRTTLELAKYQQQLRLLDPGEAFKQGLKDYGAATNTAMLDFYRTALPSAMESSTEAVARFFRDFAQGNATLSDSWKALGKTIEDVVFDIIQDLIQLQLKMAVVGVGQSLFAGAASAVGGGSTGAVGGAWENSAITSGWFHSGGKLGYDQPTFTRAVPLSIFMNAPRFHTGLKGDEFPAILQHGESVLTQGQMAAIGKGLSAGNGGQNVTVNIIEDKQRAGTTQQRQQNGGNVLDVFVSQIKSAIANDVVRGGGVVSTAFESTYALNRSVAR